MTEKKLFDRIFQRYPRDVLLRNDNGTAWTGKAKRLSGGRVLIENARMFAYGLGKGSADLVGWRVIEITPEMVGQKVAVFRSVEAKTENDSARDDQYKWARRVQTDGGIAEIIHETDGELWVEEF